MDFLPLFIKMNSQDHTQSHIQSLSITSLPPLQVLLVFLLVADGNTVLLTITSRLILSTVPPLPEELPLLFQILNCVRVKVHHLHTIVVSPTH